MKTIGKKIKTGCNGFPVSQAKYAEHLAVVELYRHLDESRRMSTFEKWRKQLPRDFEFITGAPAKMTHPVKHSAFRSARSAGAANRTGYLQNTSEIDSLYATARHVARLLSSQLLFFHLPSTLTPHADNIGRLQQFFGRVNRDGLRMIWEPPHGWPASLVEKISKSLILIPAMNPLAHRSLPAADFRYFRLGTPTRTSGVHRFSDRELRDVHAACDRPVSYVIFNNGPTAFEDAGRFARLVAGHPFGPAVEGNR